jgi:hypothetical protein
MAADDSIQIEIRAAIGQLQAGMSQAAHVLASFFAIPLRGDRSGLRVVDGGREKEES